MVQKISKKDRKTKKSDYLISINIEMNAFENGLTVSP